MAGERQEIHHTVGGLGRKAGGDTCPCVLADARGQYWMVLQSKPVIPPRPSQIGHPTMIENALVMVAGNAACGGCTGHFDHGLMRRMVERGQRRLTLAAR